MTEVILAQNNNNTSGAVLVGSSSYNEQRNNALEAIDGIANANNASELEEAATIDRKRAYDTFRQTIDSSLSAGNRGMAGEKITRDFQYLWDGVGLDDNKAQAAALLATVLEECLESDNGVSENDRIFPALMAARFLSFHGALPPDPNSNSTSIPLFEGWHIDIATKDLGTPTNMGQTMTWGASAALDLVGWASPFGIWGSITQQAFNKVEDGVEQRNWTSGFVTGRKDATQLARNRENHIRTYGESEGEKGWVEKGIGWFRNFAFDGGVGTALGGIAIAGLAGVTLGVTWPAVLAGLLIGGGTYLQMHMNHIENAFLVDVVKEDNVKAMIKALKEMSPDMVDVTSALIDSTVSDSSESPPPAADNTEGDSQNDKDRDDNGNAKNIEW